MHTHAIRMGGVITRSPPVLNAIFVYLTITENALLDEDMPEQAKEYSKLREQVSNLFTDFCECSVDLVNDVHNLLQENADQWRAVADAVKGLNK